MDSLCAADSKNRVSLAFACDQSYLPYASVLLESILESLKKARIYDIFVLFEGRLKGLERLQEQVKRKPNVNLCAINVTDCLNTFDLRVHSHLSRATYYRLCLPLLFNKQQRIIYVDVDTLILKDPAELYDTNLNGHALGACVDLTQQLWIKEGKKLYYPYFVGKAEAYLRDYLQLKDPSSYFQAGVLLFDLHKLREEKLVEKFFDLLAQSKPLHWLDQDILNIVFNTRGFKTLDLAWNFIYSRELPLNLPEWQSSYYQAEKHPAIIHYASSHKPWFYPLAQFSPLWWQVACKSPFINEIKLSLRKNNTLKKKLKRKFLSLFQDETKMGILARELRAWLYRL